jgi:hypothetical protein
VSGVSEVVALVFEAPSGELLRFEWVADELAALVPDPGSEPVWRLAGELDWDRVELVRVLSARLEDGRLLAIAGLRPAGAEGHGAELVAGALGNGDSFEQLDEALVSTEYGPDGLPRRVGLELYLTEHGLATRIAADVTGVTSSMAGGVKRVAAALALRGGRAGAGALDLLQST